MNVAIYNLQRYSIATLVFMILVGIPLIASAWDLIPCATTRNTGMCTFNDLIKLVQEVINFLIYAIAAPICAIMFVYAGWLYLSAGDNSGQINQAHAIFWNVLWGFIVILAAWLIVKFVVDFLVGPDPLMNMLG